MPIGTLAQPGGKGHSTCTESDDCVDAYRDQGVLLPEEQEMNTG